MSSGNGRKRYPIGIIIAAIVTVAFLIGGLAAIRFGFLEQVKHYRNAEQNSAKYTRNTYAPEVNRCLHLPRESQADCVAQASNEERKYRRDEQDLAAQKTSAIWACLMGSAALIGMILSAFGVFLVWRTFNATSDANRISRRVGEAQIRAYLTVENVRFEWIDSHDANFPYRIEPTVVWKNTGQSPANRVRMQHSYKMMEKEDFGKPVPDFENQLSEFTLGNTGISGGKSKLNSGSVISEFDVSLWLANRVHLVIYAIAAFEDVFERTWKVESCSSYHHVAATDPIKRGTVKAQVYPHHNDD